jgi:serine/threonine protein phosphatase PrpC
MGSADSKLVAIDPKDLPNVQLRVKTAARSSTIPSEDTLRLAAVGPQILNEEQLQARINSPLDYCLREEWTLPTQQDEECKAVLQHIKQNTNYNEFKRKFFSKRAGYEANPLAKKNNGTKTRTRANQPFKNALPDLGKVLNGRKVVSIDAMFPGYSIATRKKSQDSTVIDYIVCPEGAVYLFIADFDGHGEYGTEISSFAASVIPAQLARLLPPGPPKSSEKVFKAFKDCFQLVQNYCEKEELDRSGLSGTTATCLLVTDSKVYCAYVGDSKAILYRQEELQSLIRPHHFDEYEERKRALAEGRECSIRRVELRPGVEAGPLRIFVKGTESPGLAMSRSLGDCDAHRVGVSAIPEFVELTLSSSDESFDVFAGSDGLWDEIEPSEVMLLLYNGLRTRGLKGSVESLLQESCRRWVHKQVGIVDDISFVGVFFNLDEDQLLSEEEEEFKE